MEDLVKIILSFGYTIIILAILSIILSGGEIIYAPHAVLLFISIIIGVVLVAIAILIAKGKLRFP